MNIMYVHGMLGSANGRATQLLKQSFPNDNVFGVDYNDYDPYEAIEDIRKFYLENDVDLVIGCSLGGFYTQMLCNRPKILINPAINGDELKKYVSGSLEYVSSTFVEDLDRLSAHFLAVDYDYEYYCETTTIFCKHDDVIPFTDDRLALYKSLYRNEDVRVVDEGFHRVTSAIIPLLSELVEEVRKNVA